MGERVAIPRILYKYIPSKFVDSFRNEGNILFRNLNYFKKIEDGDVRGDILEGIHRDTGKNDNGIDITINKTGQKLKGDYFDNSIDSERVFIFCLSNIYDERLFDEFECDACIKINNTKEFIKECKLKLSLHREKLSKLYYSNVEYYDHTNAVSLDLKNAVNIPLFKRKKYFSQQEYRLFFFVDSGFKVTKTNTSKNSNSFNLPPNNTPKPEPTELEKIISLGNIRPITEVIYKP